ncbi:MAG: ATP-binding protein [Taibaiella sp.]|jgi:signal transduction histidine kinase
MLAQRVKICKEYYNKLLGLTIVFCTLLPSGIIARSNPYQSSTASSLKVGNTTNPEMLMRNYATWDTNRIDDETARLYADLSRAYAETGDKEKAYHFFEKYRKIKDSLFYQAKNLEIHKLKQDLAEAGKDKELATKSTLMMHNQELANRKNAIVMGLAGSILLILILCLQSVKSYVDKRNLLKKIREQMDQDMAISMLQASMQGEHRERDRIAIQLRNNIRPLLQNVQMQLEDIEQNKQNMLRSNAFSETQKIVGSVQQELENIATALASGMESQGLVTAFTRFIRNIPNENALSVKFTVTGKERRLPSESEMIIYRVLQELVQNIMKHAQAKTANIVIDYGETVLSIQVQDNGMGFDTKTFDQGIGWSNIRERILYLKGSCTRYNEAGTTILICLPI